MTIQSLVDIGSERIRIDVRQATPPSEEGCCVEAWSVKRPEFGYGPSVAGNNEAFSGEYTVDNFAAVIAQFSNAHTSHGRSVSRVRRSSLFGSYRKPEAAIVSYELLQMLDPIIEDLVIAARVKARIAEDDGTRSLEEVEARPGLDLD